MITHGGIFWWRMEQVTQLVKLALLTQLTELFDGADQHETLQTFPLCERLGNRWPLILHIRFMCLSPLSRH